MALNQTGISKVTAVSPKTIIATPEMAISFPCIVANTGIDADADGKKIIKAGTPLAGSLEARGTAFTKASVTGGTKGTWTVTISTAFAAEEIITINGVNYTCGTTQSATDKVFAGVDATAQAASLVEIVSDDKFTLTSSTGTITFTQKIADAAGAAPTVTKTATTGAIGSVTAGTSPVSGTFNGIGLALHDVDVTGGNANATIIVQGVIKVDDIDTTTQAALTADIKKALNRLIFIK